MAASAWEFFNVFKNELGQGLVDLTGAEAASGVFQMRLFQSSAQLSATIASTIGSLTNEVAGNSNYGARSLANINWSVKTTTSTFSWTFDTVVWTAAAASAISSISYAVIYLQTASTLICWSRLTTAQFDVSGGNEYHVYPNTVCFELS